MLAIRSGGNSTRYYESDIFRHIKDCWIKVCRNCIACWSIGCTVLLGSIESKGAENNSVERRCVFGIMTGRVAGELQCVNILIYACKRVGVAGNRNSMGVKINV